MFKRIVIAILIAGIALANAPARAALQVNDIVVEVVSGTVAASDQPGGKVYRQFAVGERFTWDGTTQTINGRRYLPIKLADGLTMGWISPENEQLIDIDPTRTTDGFDLTATGKIGAGSRPVTLFREPKTNAQVTDAAGQIVTLLSQTQFTIMDGPRFGELYAWWKIRTASGLEGWVIDTPFTMESIKRLQVYGVDVCSEFQIRTYGVAGWDSFMDVKGTFFAANERIVCLASTNLTGASRPVVVVLAERPGEVGSMQQFIRVFELRNGQWILLLEQAAVSFARTDRLIAYDLLGEGKPALIWAIRNDGTGQFLQVNVFRYVNEGQGGRLVSALAVSDLYKGRIQLAPRQLVALQGFARGDEANCCITGMLRTVWAWDGAQFAQVLSDSQIAAYSIQVP